MRYLRNIAAISSRNALGYAKMLYVALLVVWSLLTIWRVASGSLLETPGASPTLIKIDLLETVAFLAAWSLLLITITTKVVNKGRDLEFAADESIRKLDELQADLSRHEESHPDIRGGVEGLEAKVSDVAEKVMQAEREAERVTEENEQLRKQLEAKATKDALGDD